MRAEITKDLEIRTSSIMLWFALLAPPFAWAVGLQLRYALIDWACANHREWLLTLFSAPLLLVALSGVVIGWRYANDDQPRIRFMALSAIALAFAFSLAIIAGTVPDFFLRPCE
ncbi:MAG TPA: hypothetical protein VII75_15360 [Thermoanaerobaculia bacterium]|jgi:hypothetical protein